MKQIIRKRLDTVTLMIAGTMLWAVNAFSDGYRNPPPTAEGIGKSGANSVFVDDASAISYNPANLSLQTDASIVASLTLARTENTYKPPLPVGPFESDAEWYYLPNLYYAQPIGDNGLAVGLGITTPYGQGITWSAADFTPAALSTTSTVPYEASIMMIDINPTVAFKINEAVRLGVGLDVYYSMLELKAINGELAPGLPLDVEGEGNGWGIGANAGLTWLTTEDQRLALTFRSGFEVDYSGDFKVAGANAGDFETTIKYPNSVGIGYGIELTDRIQIEALVEWLQWSVNDTQSIKTGPKTDTIVNNWDDTFTLGFGGSWIATDWLVARAGYAYIPTPIPDETISPLLPDADRHAISIGLGYMLGGHMFDLAYTFSIYSDRSAPVTGESPGTYKIDSNLIGLTYSYSF